MANVCMYGMYVNGTDENVEKLVSYMKGNETQRLCGVNTDEVLYMCFKDKHIINGGCRHSVYISMLNELGSYYERLEDKAGFTTLEELSAKLNLKLEIGGNGDVAGDDEKIIIEKGHITLYK